MTRTLSILALLLAAACATTPAPPAATTTTTQPAAATETAPPETTNTRPRGVIIPARGLSCNSAIVINATNEHAGIAEENAWIQENYPGARKAKQSLTKCNDKMADIVDVETANGRTVSLYFDISNFFGKY